MFDGSEINEEERTRYKILNVYNNNRRKKKCFITNCVLYLIEINYLDGSR